MTGSELIVFRDRLDAGQRLAGLLAREDLADAVVVGLARGGVEVAAEVSRALELPLDGLAVRKVGHPLEPEYGIGAVTPHGGVYVRGHDGLTDGQLDEAIADASRRADALDARIHARRPSVDVRGRTCLLVDDGLATGATMLAGIRWAKEQGARQVVVAVPVGAPDTIARIEEEADRVVALETPDNLIAVGFWYRDFLPVEDERVVELLDVASVRSLRVRADAVELPGDLVVPGGAVGAVAFAHGSGSSRASPRNRLVAQRLQSAGLATFLFDLLTEQEALDRALVFDVPLLAERLVAAYRTLRADPAVGNLPVGFFGASTGAAAALWAAAELGSDVRAVVSRGGRPDLAGDRLALVQAPTLLIVGGADEIVLELNRDALEQLRCAKELVVVPGATHLFEEPGTLERVADEAARWFAGHLPLS